MKSGLPMFFHEQGREYRYPVPVIGLSWLAGRVSEMITPAINKNPARMSQESMLVLASGLDAVNARCVRPSSRDLNYFNAP
jgi:hypothetical protein